MLSFSMEGALGLATVMPWKEYATARAAWRARKVTPPSQQPQSEPPPNSIVARPLVTPDTPIMDVDEEEALRAKRSRDG